MKSRVITSLFLYFMFLSGTVLIISGYYFLQIDEVEIYKNLLGKSGTYSVKTYDGKVYNTRRLSFYKTDGEIYLRFDRKTVPVSQINLIDGVDINTEVVKELSKNAITGIVLTASGGLLLIFSVVLKDYL